MYGGKVLEKITHTEDPWMEARKGYGIDTEDGLRRYIHDMLDKAS